MMDKFDQVFFNKDKIIFLLEGAIQDMWTRKEGDNSEEFLKGLVNHAMHNDGTVDLVFKEPFEKPTT